MNIQLAVKTMMPALKIDATVRKVSFTIKLSVMTIMPALMIVVIRKVVVLTQK